MAQHGDDDSAKTARAVEEIQAASILVGVVLLVGPAWTIVVVVAGWTTLTWIVGVVLWSLLLFGAVHNLQTLRCPQCGRPWREPLSEFARRRWPTQRRCSACGFRLSYYEGLPDTIDPRGPEGK
jgi:hypothetical protein